MAIYHLSTKAISRAKGRSAPAAAAYRAGCRIANERTGHVHDFRRRSGVVSADIVLPAGAAPELADRSRLWNAAEAAEKRKDACVAREYELALPAELDDAQRRVCALAFAQALAEQHGIAVDVCIHAPDREGDDRNHHAHVLTTTRIAGPDGLGDKAAIEKAGRKRKEDLEATRQLWERIANEHLALAGSVERVDRRSLRSQQKAAWADGDEALALDLERDPTIHMGPKSTAIERDGRETPRTERQRERKEDRQRAREAAVRVRIARLGELIDLATGALGLLCRRALDALQLAGGDWKQVGWKDLHRQVLHEAPTLGDTRVAAVEAIVRHSPWSLGVSPSRQKAMLDAARKADQLASEPAHEPELGRPGPV